mgnify:CR=1 FL=1
MSEFDASKFLAWWFDTHYIWSTVLTSFGSFMWAVYNDLTTRALVSFTLSFFPSIFTLIGTLLAAVLKR